MRVLVTSAGTGGHINPAIAIANKIKNENKDCEILFIGRKEGMEHDLITKAGYDIKGISTGKLLRKLTLKNVKEMINAYKGISDSKKILKQFNPDICIGTGGYICMPVMLAARSLKIPYVLHESNSYPGLSTKLLAKKASKVLCGFEKTIENLGNNKNYIYTGTPSTINYYEYNKLDKNECRNRLNIDLNKKVILVTFGSQGAKYLNYKIMDMILQFKNENILYVLITGANNYDEVLEYLNSKNKEYLKYIKLEKYVYNMQELYKASDMCITRAGALTITELVITKKPALLIPLPYATENHQYHNALVIEEAECGKIIEEKNFSNDEINKYIIDITQNDSKLIAMENNYNKILKLDVIDVIYNEIKEVIKK